MQLESLEVFREVAAEGSFTGAADSLRSTQSAVSRQIAALEARLGVQLFDRLPRGVELTEQGRCFLPHAEAVLDRLSTARRDLASLDGLGAGRVRLGAFATAVAGLVPWALAEYRRAHPGVDLALVEGNTPVLLERLLAGDAEAAVVSAPPDQPLDAARFELRHLLDEGLYVAVSAGHRLAGAAAVRFADLAEESFIAGSPVEDTVLRARLPQDFRPRIDLVAAGWTAKLGCVAAGLGYAIVPALATRSVGPDIALLPLHPADASARQVFAATVAGRSRPPAVSRMLDILEQTAQRLDLGQRAT
jgi:DNA-binding transcriptional LysR family regulator